MIAFSYDRAGLLYYLHRAGFTGQIVSFPSWLDTQVGWVDTEADLARELTPEVERLLAKCRTQHARSRQVFLLIDYHAWNQEGPRHAVNRHLLDALVAAGYEALPGFPEAKIWRLERGTAPAGQGASSAGGGVAP